jgi:hypothetical protein
MRASDLATGSQPNRLRRMAIERALARLSQPLQIAWLMLLTIGMAARYLYVYTHAPLAPHNTEAATAWFGWADQAAYYLSARGWATGDLSPAQHLYPSGYALLVAPFYWLFPAEPFAIPDLLCWIAAMWLFAALGARLLGRTSGALALAATVFALIEVADSRVLYTWELPWTSTPSATLTFAALLLAVRQWQAPYRGQGVAAAICAGLIAPIRPTDALVVMPVTALVLFAATITQRQPIGKLARIVAGFAIGPALFAATHLLINGWALGRYLKISRLIGFEPLLLPLRWVTLVLGPQPLYPAGEGLGIVYPYILPGIAGIFVAILADRGRRFAHIAVGGGAIATLCLYLCYRDLQVTGLFTVGNQHYFKWTLPVFALYAVLLPFITLRHRCWRVGLGAMAVVTLLSLWRPIVTYGSLHASVLPDGSGLSLPDGLPNVNDRLDVRAPDDFLSIYYGAHTIDGLHRPLLAGVDFKTVPIPWGMSLIPLRPIPGPVTLHFVPSLKLDPASPVFSLRQSIAFGIPCAVFPSQRACRPVETLRPPPP